MRFRATLLLFSFPLIAQNQGGDYSVSGTVINSLTGEPVKNALVFLARVPEPSEFRGNAIRDTAQFAPHNVMTGADGTFHLAGLPSGRYSAEVQKPGFNRSLAADNPSQRTISVTSPVSGVELKIAPLGVIKGRVLDQYGEPLRGVAIQAFQVRFMNGFRDLYGAFRAVTDDRGMYRIANLRPGKYYVKAAGRSGTTLRFLGGGSPYFSSSWESFAPVYAGGAHDFASATPAVIESGSELTEDFNLTLQPSFKIHGSLSNVSGGQTARFELLQGDDDPAASRASLNTSGRFDIQDVIPGTYILRAAQGQTARAEATVTIKDGDLDGVDLSLAPGVKIDGIVNSSGGAGFSIHPNCSVLLHSGSPAGALISFRHTNDGFQANNIFPGHYTVIAQCFGGYPVSIMSGSTDLLSGPELTVEPGVAPPPIEINLKAGGGTILGKIDAAPVPQTSGVLLVPTSGANTGPRMLAVLAAPQNAPVFGMANLAPGDYILYLFAQRDEVPFRDPEFLRNLTGGVQVHIGDGDTQPQTVTLRSFAK